MAFPPSFVDRLLAAGVVSRVQLQDAATEQTRTGADIPTVLVQAGYCSDDDIARARALAAGMAFVDLRAFPIDRAAVALVPGEVARRRHALPVRQWGQTLLVAVAEPTASITAMSQSSGLDGRAALASVPALDAAIERWYPATGDAPAGSPRVDVQPAAIVALEVVAGAAWSDAVGTAPWQRVLVHVHQTVARQVRARRGQVVSSWGDTALVRFDDADSAVACARRTVEVVHEMGVDLRVAVHVTAIELQRGHPAALDLPLAGQLAAAAGPGEVIVTSEVVAALPDLDVFDHGQQQIAGIGPVAAYTLA